MRIAQFGQFPLNTCLVKGGVESSVLGLAQALCKSHEVFVFDIPRFGVPDTVEMCEGMTVYRFNNAGKRNLDMIKRIPDIMNALRETPVDICHLHGTGPFNLRLYKALEMAHIPVVVTVHGLIRVEKKKQLKQHFSFKTLFQYLVQSSAEKRLLALCPHAIVDTRYVSNSIFSFGWKKIPQLHIIPQGIRTSFMGIHCSSESSTILSVGAFSRRKGHLLLVKAFERVSSQIPQAHLVICGTIAEKDYFDEVMAFVSSSPVRERISFKIDATLEQLIPIFQSSHLFALHSQEESQGIALAEALAAGLPVVATKVGGIPDVVTDGETGLLAGYGDVDQFARNLADLLTDPIRWGGMSKRGQIVAQKYSWDIIADSVVKLYFSVLQV